MSLLLPMQQYKKKIGYATYFPILTLVNINLPWSIMIIKMHDDDYLIGEKLELLQTNQTHWYKRLLLLWEVGDKGGRNNICPHL